MKLLAFFTDSGVPATGLFPVIRVITIDGDVVVNDKLMTEIESGFYKYDFTDYDADKDYVIRADGGASLPTVERYVYTTNEVDTSIITTTVKQILGLSQSNYRIISPQYDRNNNLISALIKTYNNASDCENNTNPLAQYQVTATYVKNKMSTYKVKEL